MLPIRAIVVIASILIAFSSCRKEDSSTHRHDETYTCPMHPAVVSDHPGKCPICGMDLVRKNTNADSETTHGNVSDVLESTNERIISRIKVVRPIKASRSVELNLKGIVTYDTRNIFTVPSRVQGRIDRLYIKYPYQAVRKGEKVAEIYSPQMLSAQREFLFVLQNDSGDESLRAGAKRKLELLGMTVKEIHQLESTKTPLERISIFSPHSGYVIVGENAAPTSVTGPTQSSAGGMSNGMGGGSNEDQGIQSTGRGKVIREGAYVNAGETLIQIVDDRNLRIEFSVPAISGALLKKGDLLTVEMGHGPMKLPIDLIQPFFNENEDFLKIRVEAAETHAFHVGDVVTSRVLLDSNEGLWVPRSSVVDLGKAQVVFLKKHQGFEPSRIEISTQTNDSIKVVHGLSETDSIAYNGQYLVDSESLIKIK